MLAPVAEFVVRNLVVRSLVPRVGLNEFVTLLPLPKASLELKLVDIALTEFSTILHELVKVSILKLSFDKLRHGLLQCFRLFLELGVRRVLCRVLFRCGRFFCRLFARLVILFLVS